MLLLFWKHAACMPLWTESELQAGAAFGPWEDSEQPPAGDDLQAGSPFAGQDSGAVEWTDCPVADTEWEDSEAPLPPCAS